MRSVAKLPFKARKTGFIAILAAFAAILVFASPVSAQTLTQVSITKVSDTSFRMDFTIDSNPTDVFVTHHARYRESGTSDWSDRSTFSRGTTATITLFSLSRGTTYEYEASLKESFPSEETLSGTFTTPDPDFRVSTVSVGSITQTGAVVTVTTTGSSGNAQVRFQSKESGGDWSASQTATSTGTVTFTLSKLMPETSYEVRASFDHNFPNSLTVKATFDTLPLVSIDGVAVENITQTTATVTVNTTGADNTMVHLRHRLNTLPVNWNTQSATASDPSVEFSLTGLRGNTDYVVQASLYSNFPEGVTVSHTFLTGPVKPDAPTGVRFTGYGDQWLKVSWTAPANNGGAAITGYRVEYQLAGGEWSAATSLNVGSDATELQISALTSGSSYDVRVYATNSVGEGPASSHATDSPAALPGAPTDLKVTDNNASLDLSWTAPSSDGGAPVTGYYIQWKSGSDAYDADSRQLFVTETYGTIPGLDNDTLYSVRVSAVNKVGGGAWLTGGGTPHSGARITSVAPTSLSHDSATLGIRWVNPSPDAEGFQGWAYLRYRGASPVGAWTNRTRFVLRFFPGGDVITLSGLTPSTEYEVQASVKDSTDALTAADFHPNRIRTIRFTTSAAPAEKPGKPTISAVTPGVGSLTVTWSAPSSDGGAPITGYKVLWKSGNQGFSTSRQRTTDGETTTDTIPNLNKGVLYTVRVIAMNSAGDSDPSDQMTGTPLGSPGAPAVSAQPGETSLVVSWTPPSVTGGSPITGYNVQWRQSGTSAWNDRPALGANAASDTIPNLTGGTTYQVRVRAVNGHGNGDWRECKTPGSMYH